ncbi:aado/keto reductase [Crucibulum laeve]|uniref:Aado/keto reductase n=1 Tax=Crucibulum laeve TaxID=68775 RepID=A0A5C3MIE5_9AGAR|nr:aado/keto reductase [Crucibulum laeve]
MVPELVLNTGAKIPAIGMGCWMGSYGGGERVFEMCEKALKTGYRHFDTAAGYGNEKMVGKAIRASGVSRSEIFLTTKLANADHHRVREAFEDSLRELDCEYIDLYLLHWPQGVNPEATERTLAPDEHPTFVETYLEMEKLLDTGKVKAIGVSNFSIKTLKELLSSCSIVPATNQVELHPCLPQEDLMSFCNKKGIILTAYSPLGRSKTFFDHTTVKQIAEKLNASAAQVVLSWGVQRGTVVIPKSEDQDRMKANLTLVKLSKEDVEALDTIHVQPGMHRSLLTFHNAAGTVFGWTYEQLGWDMVPRGVVRS